MPRFVGPRLIWATPREVNAKGRIRGLAAFRRAPAAIYMCAGGTLSQMAKEKLAPDLCVIGGGSAGTAAAVGAAALGRSVVLVRPAQSRGEGAADVARTVHAFAAVARSASPTLEAARDRAQSVIADFAKNASDARLSALGVRVLRAEARFVDPATVHARHQEISARRYLLAPASVPALPPVRGLPRMPHLTPDRILELRELPGRLIVIGAGATGLAFAQAFRRFGSEVIVLDVASPLEDEDSECAAFLLAQLQREGITIRGNADVERIEGKRGALRVFFSVNGEKQTRETTHVLIASGRKPDLDTIDLEKSGVELADGRIRVRAGVRTSNSRVFMIADDPDALHAGRWQGQLVLSNLLFRTPLRSATKPVPRIYATEPELAHVGTREEEARTGHSAIRILRAPAGENERSEIDGEGKGTIKLVTAENGRLLGATIVGPGAGERIAFYALAISRGLNIRDLTGPWFPAFTRAEAGRHAVLSAATRSLTPSWLQRIIAAMRPFG